jgi:hypothetical protein
MQPEQPNPSTDAAQAPDAAAQDQTSGQPAEGSSESPRWWQRMFNRREPGESDPQGGESEQPGGASQSKLSLTPEELDRRVQAETDRRESKRAEAARAAERKRLRDEDPWAYAEQDRKEEQSAVGNANVESFFSRIGSEHDRASIDPVVELLPLQERQRIMSMQGAGAGLEGRKLVVKEAMKALEKHWKTEGAKDAERKLRSNAAFRKQVLAEMRGETVEPELLPAYGGSQVDQEMSSILRKHYNLG